MSNSKSQSGGRRPDAQRAGGQKPEHRNPQSKIQNPAILAAACTLGLIVVVLAAVALSAQYHFETRGMPQGFPEPIAYVEVPRWGINVALEQYDIAALNRNLDAIEAAGFSWLRQTFPWAQIEPKQGQYDWTTWDRVVKDASKSRSLEWVAVLDTSPAWSQSSLPNTHYSPTDPADFARFAGEFAGHYGGVIDFYQIWDEPNLGDRWNGEVNPVAYAELLRQAREAILANDPTAVILLAGLAPTVENSRANMSDWLYLRRLYEVGAGKYFDIASGKPYGFSTGPDDRRVDPDVLNFSHVILMREEMERHGDAGKPIWASHFGWNSLPEDWQGKPSVWGQVTQEQQASFTLDALQRVRREWPWMGVMVLENWQPTAPADDPRWGFAMAGPGGLRSIVDAYSKADGTQSYGIGYHSAARPQSLASKTYVAGPAEFSPREHWSFSELGADWMQTGDKVTIKFAGTGLALRVRRAADRANFYIAIDGQPANALPRDNRGAFLQLIPPDVQSASVDTVPVARGLVDGGHTAEIVAERGWSQRSLVGWSVEAAPPVGRKYTVLPIALAVLGLVFVAGGVFAASRIEWRTHAGLAARLGDAVHAALMVITAVVFYASTWLTWSQDIPNAFRRVGDGTGIAALLGLSMLFYYSPWLVVTLFSGLALFVLILFRLDLGLALVALVIPFYMLPKAINQYLFSMAEIVLVMCLVSWLVHQLVKLHKTWQRPRPTAVSGLWSAVKLSSLDWAALAFVAVSFASLFVAEYAKYALREFRGIVLEPALYYLMLRTMLKRDDQKSLWRIVDALMLAGVLVAVIGLIQYAFNINIIAAEAGQPRLRSVYGSPNNVGLFLGRVLPIMLAVALLGKGRRRWWYGLSVLPVALAILLSFSKGALLLGLPAALMVIGVLAGGRWLWAAVGAVAAGGLAAIPLLRTPRFASLLDLTSGTSFFRVNVWKSALLMIRDHPLLGVGLDNFLYQYRGRYMFPDAWAEPMLSHPHNIVLDFAARLGLAGLAAGVWLQIAYWRAALPLRKLSDSLHRALAIGLMASMADFLAHGLVDASYFVIDLAFVFFMTLALVQWLSLDKPET